MTWSDLKVTLDGFQKSNINVEKSFTRMNPEMC